MALLAFTTDGPYDMTSIHNANAPFQLRKTLWIGFLSLLLAGSFAGLQLSAWPVRFRYPGEWCGVEGMRLAEMLHLRQGVPIYAPATGERFDAAIYGPCRHRR